MTAQALGPTRHVDHARQERWLTFSLRAGLVALILIAWQVAGDDSRRLSFPTPVRVVESLGRLITEDGLLLALLDSNLALVLGYGLAFLIGIPLGILTGSFATLGRLARPYTMVLIAIPMIALLPLIQAIFGIGLGARTIVVFIFSFVYITLNTELGVRSASGELKEMARSYSASPIQSLRTVVLPQAFPTIFAGARLALGRGIAGMVLGELFLVSSGIGSMLAYERSRYDSGAVFAIVLCLLIEGIIIMAFARMAERRLTTRGGHQ